jgi:NAD(P)-dependent dehydrogenase (short-subunit alcohol dehydrogenase family)
MNSYSLNNSNINIFLGRKSPSNLEVEKIDMKFPNSENLFFELGKNLSREIRNIDADYLQVLNLLKHKTSRGSFSHFSNSDWIESYRVNNLMLLNLLSELEKSKLLRKFGNGGSIVNISSYLGLYGSSNLMSYAASKASLVNISKSISEEFVKYSIRANVLTVGNIDFISKKSGLLRKSSKNVEFQGVLEVVRFLLSPKSKYISGQEFIIENRRRKI